MAEHDVTYRPRVPRETQRLLIAALIALGTIWALARVRFQEAPAPNPVTPLLDQLGSRSRLADMARDIADARSRLATWLAPEAVAGRVVLRLRGEIGLVHLADALTANGGYPLLARDPASGLAVVRIPDRSLTAPPTAWQPERGRPVYLLAASARGEHVTATPVLIDLAGQTEHPAWPGAIWLVRAQPAIEPGMFLFTETGALGGLVIDAGVTSGIVPAATLQREADRLLATPPGTAGTLGIEVTSMTPALAAATGATAGVVVNVVDPRGPAAEALAVGDAIDAINGAPIRSVGDWNARALRLNAAERVRLHVVRRGSGNDVTIAAVPASPPDAPGALGLELRAGRGGAEVTSVGPGTDAWRAGIRDGDSIRQFGDVAAPSPASIQRAYAALPAGGSIVVGITRAGREQVIGLEKHAPGR